MRSSTPSCSTCRPARPSPPGSARWGGVAVADPVLVGGRLVFPGPFPVTSPATALTFSVTLDGTPGVRTVAVRGMVGPSYVGADATVLDGRSPARAAVAVDRAPTAADVDVTTRPGTDVTVPTAAAVHDDDGDPLTLQAPSAPSHGTARLVAGSLVYRSVDGYTGPDSFAYTVSDGRGGTADGTVHVTVTETAPQPQTSDFPQPGGMLVGASGQLAATASSGLPVSFTSRTPAICTVTAGGGLTAVAAGDCTVRADQAGGPAYAAAIPVSRTLTVTTRPQHVVVTPPAGVDTGATVDLGATATSGLTVGYTALTPATCSVDSDGTVTGVAAGACSVQVTQPGDTAWAAAVPVTVDLQVTDPETGPQDPAAQQVAVTLPGTLLAGPAPYSLTPTSTSGLPVALEVVSGSCTLDGTQLALPRTGDCVVRATQAGDDAWAPATSAERTVHVVAPAGDRFTVAPAVEVPGGADLDVSANDPAGLTLHGVTPAGHGDVRIAGDRVHYTPRPRFGGRDSFSYEVADAAGRTATATVSVRVPDLAPQLEGARTAQVAGTDRRVELAPTDPNGDDVTLTARTDEPGVEVAVEGHTLVVHPRRSVSGRVEITVVATDPDGASVRAVVVDRVSPEAVDHAARTLREHGGTRVAWDAAPTQGARYQVRVTGGRLCTTNGLSCATARLLGPRAEVDVRVLGRDGTVSAWRAARPQGQRGVLVTTVYFDPDQSSIRRDQRAKLRRGVQRVHASGFGTAELRGYTDSDGSWASGIRLSKRRTATVARWLAQAGIGSSQAWFGEGDPAAANTSAAGKARNRRVEVWVSYS